MMDGTGTEIIALIHGIMEWEHLAEVSLATLGTVALTVVFAYRGDEESTTYKVLVTIGLICGLAMMYISSAIDTNWGMGTMILSALLCFALVIRPFGTVRFDIIIGIIALVWAYIGLGMLTELPLDAIKGIDLTPLTTGTPRIVISVMVGATAYMITGFITGIILLFGRLLNCWPILMLLSDWCIIESIMIMAGCGSLCDLVLIYLTEHFPNIW
jgi:hypothetical protein